jgi:hypothetical protein
MLATQPSKGLRALCHEHHVEMRLNQSLLDSEKDSTQTLAYACTESDCLVRYNIFRGYFMLSRNGSGNHMDTVPEVRCPRDGAPMYLAETNPEKKAFRLWRCPQCHSSRTNEQDLVNEMA